NLPIAYVKKELYLKHPAPRVAALASLQYVGPHFEMREVQSLERESDVGEQLQSRWSTNNGRTWSDFVPVQKSNKIKYGRDTVWEGECVGVYHHLSGLYVQLWLRQIELKGIYHNFAYVRTSSDEGRAWSKPKQLRYETGGDFIPTDPV